jgi:hypothetical protein
MKFDHRHYVPFLRWKQGEYLAMSRLSIPAKEFITPLIEVPEIGFDFEANTLARSLDVHLSPFATRIRKHWQMRPCFVDLNRIDPSTMMADGRHPVIFVFADLRSKNCMAIPVIGINRNRQYKQAVQQVVSQDNHGLCLRVSIEDSAKENIKTSIDALLNKIGIDVIVCDLVIDLDAPNFDPVDGFTTLVGEIVKAFPYLSKWRTFTIAGTSFPSSMAEITPGTGAIPRFEWLLYKRLVAILKKARVRLPSFGDYVINHPDVLKVDMRIIKPSATVRYTIDDAWLIAKGSNVRDNGFGQYRDLCKTIVKSGFFLGPKFSAGDEGIANCAAGTSETGNLSTWRRIGTNHHLEKVVRDISNFYGFSGNP